MSDTSAQNTISVEKFGEMALNGDISAYVGGDRKFRTDARKYVQKMMKAALGASDLETGQAWLNVDKLLEATKPVKSDTVDIPALLAQRVSDHLEAARLILNGEVYPEGVTLPDTLAEMHYVIPSPTDRAKVYASAPIVKKTKEHDIPALIRRSLQNGQFGTFYKVSEIRHLIATLHDNTDVSCPCGAKVDASWDGRISAALFGKSGVPGVESVDKGHDAYVRLGGLNGAIKTDDGTWDDLDESDTEDEADES